MTRDPAKKRAQRQRYAATHREQINEKKARYRRRHRERLRIEGRLRARIESSQNVARVQRWREKNPHLVRERRRMYQAARRARTLRQFVEHVHPHIVWQRDEGICGICGHAADYATFHIDHVLPLAKGGLHGYTNVQVAHPACNLKKGARLAV